MSHLPKSLEFARYFEPPFRYEIGGIWGSGAGAEKLLDVRGWGHLTGRGAHALPETKAANAQDAMGEFVARTLTAHWPDGKLAALVDAFFDPAEHGRGAVKVIKMAGSQSTFGSWLVLDGMGDEICNCGSDERAARLIAALLNLERETITE